MGRPRTAHPVKLFAGLIGGDPDLLRRARQLLTQRFGPADLDSELWPFDQTDYYEAEMGPGLQRWFVSFERLVQPDRLAEIKRESNELEQQIASAAALPEEIPLLGVDTAAPPAPAAVSRPVNIDPGYLDLSKLVLASTKDSAHRIYLNNGIYAEVTLQYAHGAWQALPWTYPDFRRPEYHVFFSRLRERFRQQQHEAAHYEPGADVP
ncbi:MAG: DUF4416 family protein [Planctomycetota bacterium]